MILNNKGQTLVLFLVFIPMIILIGAFMIDNGFQRYNKIKVDNLVKYEAKKAVKEIDSTNEITIRNNLINNDKDLKDIKIIINKDTKEVEIEAKKDFKGFYGNLFKKDLYTLKVKYKASITDGVIKVERGS